MPFSLSGAVPEHAAGSGATGKLASWAATSDVQVDAQIPVDLPPPIFWVDTLRETLRDAAGKITGYRETVSGPGYSSVTVFDAGDEFVSSEYRDSSGYHSSTVRETLRDSLGATTGYRETSFGDGAGSSYRSVTDYDAAFNLVAAIYSDSSGYRSTSTRSELRDASGTLTGYQLVSSGSGSDYRYQSTETFDTAYTLLSSDYSDGAGYHSTYRLEIQRDAAGTVTGYLTTYSWTDGHASYSVTDRYDGQWNYLSGDSVKPDVVIDDGPKILPLVSKDTSDIARVAVSSAAPSASEALDGRNSRGTKLKGSSGDDNFIVDDTRDHVSGALTGNDTVMSSSISLDLRRDVLNGVENATLMGRSDLKLSGDSGANTLLGNAGANRLDGYSGSDTLFGGLGDDVFVIRTGQKGAADKITDFTSGEDHIALVSRAFRGLFDRNGDLKNGVLGDRLVFDANTSRLSFDRDGAAGHHSAVVIAELVGVSAVHAADFAAV